MQNSIYFSIFLLSLLSLISCSDKSKTIYTATKKSVEAKELISLLNNISETKMLFGQQDAIAYGIGWKNKKNFSDCKTITGKHPAIIGFDLSNIGVKNKNVENVEFKQMKSLVKWFAKKGGITTLSWHMLNPKNKKYAWEVEGLEENLVKKMLADEEMKKNYLKQLDAIANLLNEMVDEDSKKIPILFRPFHEANGKHFWWSSKFTTEQDFKNLWQFTHNYLTKTKKQNQLLFVFASDVFKTENEYLEFYPGDNFVDVLAFDDFHSLEKVNTHKIFENEIAILEELARQKNKPYAIAEVGNLNLEVNKYYSKILTNSILNAKRNNFPAYIFTWRNGTRKYFYTPYLNCKPSVKKDFKKFERLEFVQFLN